MAAVRAGAILVFLSVFPGSEWVSGQRAPCYECEDYKENHPQTSPYQQIRTHCSYPCECDDREPTCPPDVSVIRDGCGCCPICAGQLGQPCDSTSVCDDRKGYVCRYPYSEATVGICQATTGLPCMVFNKTYSHGETFQTDCRTQCSCQNGTYACSSLCPNENISPRGACTHPRLVEIPDQCCREWMCDSTEAEHPPICKQQFTSWSACSAECGLGLSRRVSNLNQNCILQNETRICQLRPCEAGMLSLEQHARHRHIRKGHECKATQRVRGPVRLRFGPCRSKKRYRPKFCGSCDDKLGDGCCTPQLSTTIKVEFICSSIRSRQDPNDILLELIEPGRDLWWPDDLLSIGKQRFTTAEPQLSRFSDLPAKDWMKARDNEILGDKKIPYLNIKSKDRFSSKSPPIVSKADMHLLLSKDKMNRPLLGEDVLIYESIYKEKIYPSGNSPEIMTIKSTENEKTDRRIQTSTTATEGTTTQITTTDPTTPKPKKKRKKKPRKAFTSWLEFRDEEYQMDEYEDEDEAHSTRKKRSLDGIVKRFDTRESSLGPDNQGKRYSGSFRQGFLEELQSKDDDYEDEDENDEEDDSDEDDEDEDEDSDEDDDDEDDDDEEITKRNRSPKKPVFYAFYRKKRESPADENRNKVAHGKKYHRMMGKKNGIHLLKKTKESIKVFNKQNSTQEVKLDRVTRITKDKEITRDKPEKRKKKGKKMRELMRDRGKDMPEVKESKNEIPQMKNGKEKVSGMIELARLLSEKQNQIKTNSIQEGHQVKNKTVFHIAGKVHRFRTRRHAPRPPWPQVSDDEQDEEEEEEDELEDLTWGDHTVSFSVQWIVKCRCDRDCGLDTTTTGSNNLGEVILRRVHRTAPP